MGDKAQINIMKLFGIFISSFFVAGILNASTLNDGLVAYFPFNGNLNDESGNSYIANGYNVNLTSGLKNENLGAYYFNGVNSYMTVSDTPVPTNNNFSWSFWIFSEQNSNTLNDNSQSIIMRCEALGNNTASPGVSLAGFPSKGDRVIFGSYDGGYGGHSTETYPDNFPVNTWVHICVTSDSAVEAHGSTPAIRRVFINGILSAENIAPAYGWNLGLLLLGADRLMRSAEEHDGYFKGKLDEIRIYNRALTAAEVKTLFEDGLSINSDINNDGVTDLDASKLGLNINTSLAPLLNYIATNQVGNLYGLYTTNQIHNLGLGGIVLDQDTNNQLTLIYQVMQSTDLQNWTPYQTIALPITNAPTNKLFLRVQAVGQ